jgi:hypothetical protein
LADTGFTMPSKPPETPQMTTAAQPFPDDDHELDVAASTDAGPTANLDPQAGDAAEDDRSDGAPDDEYEPL